MRRPVGVVVAAIALGLMALMGLFGSLGSMAMSLLVQNPAIPRLPAVQTVMLITTGLMLCFCLFCLWTVVDLFRMRRWARYSILVIGALEFCFSLLFCAGMILMRSLGSSMPPVAAPSPISYKALFLGMAVFYGLVSLIGLWWLIYFNLASVRAAFRFPVLSPEPPLPAIQAEGVAALPVPSSVPVPGWRVVIVVWACLMLVSVLYLPLMVLMHTPLFLFGFVFRGGEAAALSLILVSVQLYLGIGLLKKWKPAWYVGLLWQLYTVAFFLGFLVPGVWSRFAAYEQELMARWGVPVVTGNGATVVVAHPESFMIPGMILGLIVGIGMVILLTTALLRRRQDYLHA